jgi:hypothetical protein
MTAQCDALVLSVKFLLSTQTNLEGLNVCFQVSAFSFQFCAVRKKPGGWPGFSLAETHIKT